MAPDTLADLQRNAPFPPASLRILRGRWQELSDNLALQLRLASISEGTLRVGLCSYGPTFQKSEDEDSRRSYGRPESEPQFQSKLEHPGRGRPDDLAEVTIGHGQIRIVQVDRVEQIEEVRRNCSTLLSVI
jgi:hypothetical protein